MPKRPAARSFLEQLADYQDPAPQDVDPEDAPSSHFQASASDFEELSNDEARDHYVEVSESKLRKANQLQLGPQYKGANVSREALEDSTDEDVSDEDPFAQRHISASPISDDEEEEEEEEERSSKADFGLQPGRKRKIQGGGGMIESIGGQSEDIEDDQDEDDSDLDSQGQESLGMDDSNSDQSSSRSSSAAPARDDRAALRKMMFEEQTSLASSLSAAVKADIEKGRSIKRQRQAFDSLLGVRIKLQKALVAANSLSAVPPTDQTSDTQSTSTSEAAERAESAAVQLWSSLTALRDSLGLNGLSASESKKRKLPPNASTTSSSQWTQMQQQDSLVIPKRRATLTKWSERTNPASSLRPSNQFSQTPKQLPLTTVLDQQLTGENLDRALQKTRQPRSCAPIQAAAAASSTSKSTTTTTTTTPTPTPTPTLTIYDDADFYTLLLRDLVDRRMTDPSSSFTTIPNSNHPLLPDTTATAAALLRSSTNLLNPKIKKVVDTKASKGRKMRYNVHEKLQNFMVPDDHGSWGERQREELFRSLLGRKVDLSEDIGGGGEGGKGGGMDGEGNGVGSEDEEEKEVGALRLFG